MNVTQTTVTSVNPGLWRWTATTERGEHRSGLAVTRDTAQRAADAAARN